MDNKRTLMDVRDLENKISNVKNRIAKMQDETNATLQTLNLSRNKGKVALKRPNVLYRGKIMYGA